MQLRSLGSKVSYEVEYTADHLETVSNNYSDRDYWVHLSCPEFTSICPITGQPDFGTILIDYIPDRLLVESKSLKIYLFGYRRHGSFHEDCVNTIMRDLIDVMHPRYMEVYGKFNPRGGISIHPYCNYGISGSKYERWAETRLLNREVKTN
jgi:7-cyano-7-deazaguanine reductase